MRRLFVSLLLVNAFVASSAFAQPGPRQERALALVAGRVVSDSLAPAGVHPYEIVLPPGQFVFGEADQQSVDVVLTVIAPDGRTVGRFDGPVRGPEPFQFTTEAAGPYRIEVTPFESGSGRYTLTLRRVEPAAETPPERVDQLMAAYAGPDVPGGVVAVVREGQVIFARGYGMADLEYGIPNTPETAYHVASVSKQFTAFAVAMLAEQGKLSLDDDVRKHLPELPDFGEPITLRHLLHHTSGLRDQWNLWAMAGGRMDDVIRQQDLVRLVVRQRELNFAPGAEYSYSNTGYMLLAEVVARVTGQPFGAWMRAHVFEPLGMASTQIYDDHERLVKGRAHSYQPGEGGFRKAVLSYANAGATSLFTTAVDLAKWLRNFHTFEVGGPGVASRMQERAILTRGDTLDYALGLSVDRRRGLRRIQHGGADAGYRTMVAYYPDLQAGVVVLGNVASFEAGRIAGEVAEAFFGDAMAPEEAPPPAPARPAGVAVAAELLEAYAGRYVMEGGHLVRIEPEAAGLVAHVDGRPSARLVALADTLFRIDAPDVDARISFHPEPGGHVERGAIYLNRTIPIQRVAPWRPDAGELEAYAGWYYSPELEAVYRVRAAGDHLVAQHRRHGDIVLTPTEQDLFRGDAWFFSDVVFERNGAGGVTGMRVSNGRVRNLRLEKQDE